ncbi:MAG TPA: hypothetical protein VFC67_15370 [Prolixibacteraceae bacterium]|nr:hypothetical protein [Prolixibacteraceae bacterium]
MRLIKRKYLESVTSGRLWGRFSADLGPAEEISIGAGLVLDPVSGEMTVDKTIKIPATTFGYDGTIIRLTSAIVLAFGDVCYINISGKAALASAATEATATGVVMCVESMLAANTEGVFLLYGIARKDTWNWTVGGGSGLIYLSIAGTSGNTLAQTVVSAEDNVSQILGFATHASRIFFNPSLIQTVYKA